MISLCEGDKVIRNVPFTSKQLKNRGSFVADFDTVVPKGESIYTIRISSSDATKEDTVEMIASYHCDSVANKAFKIDGERQGRELVLSVRNRAEATHSSKEVYLGICALMLVIELLGFGTLFMKGGSQQ